MKHTIESVLRLYRDAYSGHPREIWALTILTFVNRMGTMVLPFLSVYLTTVLGFSLKTAGIIVSAFGIGSLAGSYIGGKLSDRIGANNVIVLSLVISGILFINMQFVDTIFGLFAMILSTALFGEAYRPAMSVAVGQYVPKRQTGRTMSLIRLAINLGMAAAPAIGGFIAVSIGYSWLFWIDGLTCILAAGYFYIVSRRWKSKVSQEIIANDELQKARGLKPYRNVSYMFFLGATFLVAFSFIQWFHTVPVFIKTVLGLDERYIGMLLGFSSLYIILVEMPVIHTIEHSGRISAAIRLGLILIGMSFLILIPSEGLLICLISVFIWTSGEILFLPFNTSMSINLSPEESRGDYQSWYWMTWSLANIFAPIIGLYVAENFGFSTLWIIIALMVPINLFFISRVREE